MHRAACSCHDPRGATTHHGANLPIALPSGHADLEIVRELVRVRAACRYADRHDLLRAFDELRRRIAADGADPLELRCWIGEDTVLHVDLTVPMFGDHGTTFAWCDLLESSALSSTFEVHTRSL